MEICVLAASVHRLQNPEVSRYEGLKLEGDHIDFHQSVESNVYDHHILSDQRIFRLPPGVACEEVGHVLWRVCIGRITGITDLIAVAADLSQPDCTQAEATGRGSAGAVRRGLALEGEGLFWGLAPGGLSSVVVAGLELGLGYVTRAAQCQQQECQ